MIEIYTDGSCDPNPGPGSCGYVVVNGNIKISENVEYYDQTTSNRMEMQAILNAFSYLNNNDSAVIYSDSQLCVMTYNEWMHKWKDLGWYRTKKSKQEVKNLDLVKILYCFYQSHPNVVLKWVKGHADNKWNNYIDRLISPKMKHSK